MRTRFAPSPTGLLHLGNVRTALFNWLLSRHEGGAFDLRIEDTDTARNTPEAVQAIHDTLDWLGMTPDRVVVQSSSRARHQEVCAQLLASGHAYRCAMTPEQIETQRAKALAAKQPFLINSPWRDGTPVPPNTPSVIRLRAQRTGVLELHDMVQGLVKRRRDQTDDLILARSDGTPTYMLAVVVDDHDMDITHVLRGDDHMTNTFRQVEIFEACGWEIPTFGHIPLILDPSGKKMSKRTGAIGAMELARDGILPQALCNALLRLGWDGDVPDIVSMTDAAKVFSDKGLNRAAARYDPKKLMALNGAWIRQIPLEQFAEMVLAWMQMDPEDPLVTAIRGLLPAIQERSRTMVEAVDQLAYLSNVLVPDEGAQKALTEGRTWLTRAHAGLSLLTDWSPSSIHEALEALVDGGSLKLVAQPLRAAITGRLQSPPIDVTLAALPQAEVLARLAQVLL